MFVTNNAPQLTGVSFRDRSVGTGTGGLGTWAKRQLRISNNSERRTCAALRRFTDDLMTLFASRFWRLCFCTALAFSLIGGSAVAQMRISIPEVQQAWTALQRGDCEAAWNTLWPLAKSGNQEARSFLYFATGRVNPPGVTKDHASWHRHVLALAAYAALAPPELYLPGSVSDGRFARQAVPSAIRGLNLGANGERVSQCYASDASLEKCLNLGISLGVIPTFEEYARETELAARNTGITASCVPRY
jgi:hypothetical protein